MSLDYRKGTYRPSRPNTRNVTSYGSMSKWIPRRHETIEPKGTYPQILLERSNASPKFTKKRPIMKPSPAGMPTMYDTYVNQTSAVLDESIPVHLRYSKHCGYDDFHKAFKSIENKHPDLSYPHYGPPRLRHGRQGGSWRHVKEVLQAGGNRIVFVDGQVASDDVIKMDQIPGGHLILPTVAAGHSGTPSPRLFSHRGTPSPRLVQQMKRLDENKVAMSRDRPFVVPKVPAGTRYNHLASQQGYERENWNLMR